MKRIGLDMRHIGLNWSCRGGDEVLKCDLKSLKFLKISATEHPPARNIIKRSD